LAQHGGPGRKLGIIFAYKKAAGSDGRYRSASPRCGQAKRRGFVPGKNRVQLQRERISI